MVASRIWLDRLVSRLLFVDVQSQVATNTSITQRAERAFGFSLIVSGVRCILQYVVLPFVLPLVGLATETAVPISLAINLLAMVLIVYSLRRFWQIDYGYKWQYLLVAIVALMLLGAFIALDLKVIAESSLQ